MASSTPQRRPSASHTREREEPRHRERSRTREVLEFPQGWPRDDYQWLRLLFGDDKAEVPLENKTVFECMLQTIKNMWPGKSSLTPPLEEVC